MKQRAIERRARHDAGVVYTPATLARLLAEVSLAALHQAGVPKDRSILQIVDPACGEGALLQAASDELKRVGSPAEAVHFTGYDIDPLAIHRAGSLVGNSSEVGAQLQVADALDRAAIANQQFDLVLSNPPYVSIRRLTQQASREKIDAYKRDYQSACGCFDLYVLFVERCLELVKPGGICGLLVPSRIAAMKYATACRRLVLEQTLVEVIDLSKLMMFRGAKVYPCILVIRRAPAPSEHRVRVTHIEDRADLSQRVLALVPQSRFSPERWSLSCERFSLLEQHGDVQKLGNIATIVSGASGFTAAAMRPFVKSRNNVAAEEGERYLPFLVSGQIDRYQLDHARGRFQNVYYDEPVLDVTQARLTLKKRELYRSQKLVVSGMSQQLEVALDEVGCALAVQVFAIWKSALDLRYLLAILNSSLMHAIFIERYAAKRLAADYFSINLAQLAELPIVVPRSDDRTAMGKYQRLIILAERRLSCDREASRSLKQQIEHAIDEAVFELYGISSADQEVVRRGSPQASSSLDRQLRAA